jgi:hypothetical protein
MKKVLGLIVVAAIVGGMGPYARGTGNAGLPPDISADNWIALGDMAGFVVTNGDSSMGSTRSVGVAKGYFMVRRGSTWLRIDTSPDPRDSLAGLGR